MSRHRQNLPVARRSQGLDLRGEVGNGGLSGYRNARFDGGRDIEGFGLGSRERLHDRGRPLGRSGRRYGSLGLGGRRGEGFAGFGAMGGGFMGNTGMYERSFGYGLQSPIQMGRGPLGGEGFMGFPPDPHLGRRIFDYNIGNPRELRPHQGELEVMLSGRQQGPGILDFRRQALQSLSDVSQYGLDHLDRQPRLYHYRPPYVEDDLTDEEYLRQQDLMDMEQMGIYPEDYYGPLFEDEGINSLPRSLRRVSY